jgi:hypothetical protein
VLSLKVVIIQPCPVQFSSSRIGDQGEKLGVSVGFPFKRRKSDKWPIRVIPVGVIPGGLLKSLICIFLMAISNTSACPALAWYAGCDISKMP